MGTRWFVFKWKKRAATWGEGWVHSDNYLTEKFARTHEKALKIQGYDTLVGELDVVE